MKLFHGTTLANAEKIEKEGLKGAELIPGVRELAYVYLTYERGLAESYGEAVFELESDDLDQSKLSTYQEGIGLIHNYLGDIAPELLTRVK